MNVEDITFRDRRLDLMDEDGNIIERDVLHISGEVMHNGRLYLNVRDFGAEPSAQARTLIYEMIAADLTQLVEAGRAVGGSEPDASVGSRPASTRKDGHA